MVYFAFAGVIATGADALTFFLLTSISLNSVISKGISFVVGTIVSYFVNRLLTFRDRQSNKSLFAFGYLLGLAVNTLSYWIFLFPFSVESGAKRSLPWAGATFISAVFNFLFMNRFSFRKVSSQGDE